MQITSLFESQRQANSGLIIDSVLSEYQVVTRKNLELHVKMSDLARETKCYKYWISDEPASDFKAIFDKYICCLRQIISLGLENKYEDITNVDIEKSEYCLSDQFLNLYIDINDLIISPSKDHFITLLEDFLSLSINLDFSEEMIIEGFCKDNSFKEEAL